jgi:hypothetical protein
MLFFVVGEGAREGIRVTARDQRLLHGWSIARHYQDRSGPPTDVVVSWAFAHAGREISADSGWLRNDRL